MSERPTTTVTIVQPKVRSSYLSLSDLLDTFAYLKQVYHRRALIFIIAQAELKQSVVRSRLSYLWWLMEPMFNLACYLFLVMALGRGGGMPVPYPLFILTALMPWTWMQRCIISGATIWTQYESTITQIRFPYLVLPLSRYLHELLLYLISYVVLFGACICYGYYPLLTWLALPVVIAAHSLLILTLMVLASVVSWYFADLNRVLPFLLRLWFFSSPALYSVANLPPWAQKVMRWNPMTLIFESYRACILYGRCPNWVELVCYALVMGCLLLVALVFFVRGEPYITRHI